MPDELDELRDMLFGRLRQLQREYERAAEPIIKQLVAIKQREIPIYIVPHDHVAHLLKEKPDAG
jgi:hypothetical protein